MAENQKLSYARSRGLVTARIGQLSPDSERLWGAMTVHQAVVHLADALRMALLDGEVYTRDDEAPFAAKRHEWIHVWEWPAGRAQSPPAGFLTTPTVWEVDIGVLQELVDGFAEAYPLGLASSHPLLGSMEPADWDVLMYRHLDHHLRQFGV